MAAGSVLLLGGGPDAVDPDDPLAGPEWRSGGLLHRLDAATGKTLQRMELPAPPVHEGILPLPKGIILVLRNGTVIRR